VKHYFGSYRITKNVVPRAARLRHRRRRRRRPRDHGGGPRPGTAFTNFTLKNVFTFSKKTVTKRAKKKFHWTFHWTIY
jgi:hypothetical protein